MIAALDVQYDDRQATAQAAAVVFEEWDATHAWAEYAVPCEQVAPYVPGQFFQRELPCLLAVLAAIRERVSTIVIDGYVMLGQHPGLGRHLWDALQQQTPVIGVAKTHYQSAQAVQVLRGRSESPLYITAAGVEANRAANWIKNMAGDYRLPSLLKQVDLLARRPRPSLH
ncbi:endonuclease V [Anatilimnocola sp. NA78]|uniref:endonuclease V n=1 Tax=Anatilimnocola sp. NA78 TaxID=3415683 RepID=UPI003CE56369